jgi:iron complex outermembrane receptor protein
VISPSVCGGTLTGRIVDESGGGAVAGATVTVRSADASLKPVVTAADRDGKFELENIPAGTYNLEVSSIGFVTKSLSSIVVPESEAGFVDVTLTATLINLDALSVTASRRPEKIVDAPASVSVVESENVETRSTLTVTEHVKGLPGVDVASTGLNQSNMVVRGFNNIFSGALLVITDNRLARVPSLRYNAYNFIPTANEDIERIEIVAGPGSALYGPNAASGVMHMITKSPFTSKGTTVSIGAGERDLFIGSFRHADTPSDYIGYTITAQYYRGHDWESYERSEPPVIQKFRPTPSGPIPVGDSIPNNRDFDLEKIAGEARVDFLLSDDAAITLNGGINRADGIELTALGAGQAVGWTYSYAQARLRYKDLFTQGFVNMSDAGDTYLLPTGQLIIDRSKLWAFQIQHQYSPEGRISLTYGFDALLTRPETDGTINGSNEHDDNIDEIGAYVQSDIILPKNFKLVGAARVDHHNRLDDIQFSPRAALVYQADRHHNLRLTYNRAFSTPENTNLYLDILQTDDLGGLGASFEEELGFRPEIDVRAQGVPETGFHYGISNNGLRYHSPFAYLDTARGLTPGDYIDFNDPLFTDIMWDVGRARVMDGIEDRLDQLVQSGLINQATADEALSSIDAVTPTDLYGVNNMLMTINPDNQAYEVSQVDDVADIHRLEPTITQTVELGYKGMLGNRLKFSLDIYRTEKKNFIGPLAVETPNVFLDDSTLNDYLYTYIEDALNANPAYDSILSPLDNPFLGVGGNNNGTAADEVANYFSSGASQIPFGTVTPDEALDPTAILVTFRNFGDISYYGADLSLTCHISRFWNVGGAYSYISKNFFEKSPDQLRDINLNAPRHKIGLFLQYTNPYRDLSLNVRYRYVDAFDMDSPFYGTSVKAYHLVDLNLGLNLIYETYLSLTVQNVFDNRHIEFVGGPKIGRLAIMRLTRSF